eukprot:CFRG5110T1
MSEHIKPECSSNPVLIPNTNHLARGMMSEGEEEKQVTDNSVRYGAKIALSSNASLQVSRSEPTLEKIYNNRSVSPSDEIGQRISDNLYLERVSEISEDSGSAGTDVYGAALTIQSFWRHCRCRNRFRNIVKLVLEEHVYSADCAAATIESLKQSRLERRQSSVLKRVDVSAQTKSEVSSTDDTKLLVAVPDIFDDGGKVPISDVDEISVCFRFKVSAYPNTNLSMDLVRSIGCCIFNKSPLLGLQYLIDHNVIENETQSIVTLITSERELSKTAVGDFLGNVHAGCQSVLKALIRRQCYWGKDFVASLREFLALFRLPGEAQKIDRIMENWAQQYFSQNPDVFVSEDTPYVLAFSTIMLNTDQHNPSVIHRMTLSEFIKNNRGLDNGRDIPETLLKGLYDDVKHAEIEVQDTQLACLVGLQNCITNMPATLGLPVPYRLLIDQEEATECLRPGQLHRNYAKDKRQLFYFNDMVIVTTLSKSGSTCKYREHFFLYRTIIKLVPVHVQPRLSSQGVNQLIIMDFIDQTKYIKIVYPGRKNLVKFVQYIKSKGMLMRYVHSPELKKLGFDVDLLPVLDESWSEEQVAAFEEKINTLPGIGRSKESCRTSRSSSVSRISNKASFVGGVVNSIFRTSSSELQETLKKNRKQLSMLSKGKGYST